VSVMIGRGEWTIGNDLAFLIKTYWVDWCGERLWLCLMLMPTFRLLNINTMNVSVSNSFCKSIFRGIVRAGLVLAWPFVATMLRHDAGSTILQLPI
jgi:hypothetical protein